MNMDLFDLGAASTPILLIPAQDILKLLRTHPWSDRKLEKEELDLLKEAAKFLESVQRGQSIIRQSVEDDNFIPDVVSLDAYEYTRRALESSLPSRYRFFTDTEQFINKVHESIQTILQFNNPDEGKKHKNLEVEPRKFFETFIDYSYSRSLDFPHI
jgi:hypothetical protein